MADKQISDLVAATTVQTADLFVLEQSGTAKKLTGQILINMLTSIADGHGGIASITWQTSGTSGDGQYHYATIHYADTTTSTFTIRDGLKGDTGNDWYVYIKYSADLPTSDADVGNTPDNWIGLYSGTASTAPSHYTDYTWFQWKGDTGNTGAAATIVSQAVEYMASANGTVVPEGSWQSTIPTVAAGYFLWCRTRVTYNTGDVVTSYSVSRNGIDGQGAVSSVNEISPDSDGNIALTASDIPTADSTSVQAHLTSLESSVSDLATYEVRHISGSITSLPISFSYNFITAAHRVINCELGTPSAVTSDLTWTTSAGDVTFSGTLANLGSTTIDFDIVKVVSP
jgi:hypothetical protein